MEARQVQIGDQSYTIQRLSTFKALRVGEIVSGLLKEIPDLSSRLTDFTREFREKNSVKLPHAAAALRFTEEELARIPPAAWEQGNGYLELPASPGPLDYAAHILPTVFDEARDRVLTLLALLATSNSVLREADRNESVGEAIDGTKRLLIHEDAADLVDLFVAAAEVVQDQFSGRLGKLKAAVVAFGIQTTPDSEPTTTADSPPTISQTEKPDTSTDSEPPTDGATTRSSIESPSPPSPVSSGA